MLDALNSRQRLSLMKFVCSFAWADLEVHPKERAFVAKMVRRLELSPDEKERVEGWLETPPSPDAIDPNTIEVLNLDAEPVVAEPAPAPAPAAAKESTNPFSEPPSVEDDKAAPVPVKVTEPVPVSLGPTVTVTTILWLPCTTAIKTITAQVVTLPPTLRKPWVA